MSQAADERKKFKQKLDAALDRPIPALTAAEFHTTFFIPWSPEFKTYRDVIVHQLVLKACRGGDRSIQEIFDRAMGKPKQATEAPTEKGTSYYDFLMTLAEEGAEKNPGGPKEVEVELPETDLFQDLL